MEPIDLNYAPNSVYNYLQQPSAQPLLSSTAGPQTTGAGPLATSGLGMNMDTARLGIAGLGTIGNLWMAYQAQNLAEDQFDYTKDITDQNMANSIQTYNTTLRDRIAARMEGNGGSGQDVRDYMQKHKLRRQY